ncbi:hypothetical protein Taro_044268 [Colocasia esculenta]|uniref:Uncharacterized protein n=1 Tax=Colocasia esculenta TaxID=4460 RepID=A0A843X591_COLES|nr:hypothetical protein [Colocasia esculenta]
MLDPSYLHIHLLKAKCFIVEALPCPDHAIEAREAEKDDDEDEDLRIHDEGVNGPGLDRPRPGFLKAGPGPAQARG